jgi:hypothetical protein
VRDLTDAEWKSLRDGHCPFCNGINFITGPSGGMSTNFYCANAECEAGFNLNPGFLGNFGNQVIREPKMRRLP